MQCSWKWVVCSLTLQCNRFTNKQRYQCKIWTLMIWNHKAARVAALLNNNVKMLLAVTLRRWWWQRPPTQVILASGYLGRQGCDPSSLHYSPDSTAVTPPTHIKAICHMVHSMNCSVSICKICWRFHLCIFGETNPHQSSLHYSLDKTALTFPHLPIQSIHKKHCPSNARFVKKDLLYNHTWWRTASIISVP